MSVEAEIVDMIKTILKHQGLPEAEVEAASPLYDEGIGLDSLGVAELSSLLEKRYGKDPYTSNVLPMTLQDIFDFYKAG